MLIDDQSLLPRRPGDTIRWGAVYGAARALALAELAAREADGILVLTDGIQEAETLLAELDFFASGTLAVHVFPDLEILPYDHFSPHQDLLAQRLQILRNLQAGLPMVLLAAAPSLLPRLPPRAWLAGRAMLLRPGERLDLPAFCRTLDETGYQRVSQVSTHGDYAVRGALLDIFPTGREWPVRIDLFDDQIESLRQFDPDSQLSTAKIGALDTLPARDLPTDEAAIRTFRERYRARFEGNPARSPVYSEVSEGRLPGGIESYLPLFFEDTDTIWSYLPDEMLVVTTGDAQAALERAWQQVEERHDQVRDDPERPVLNPDEAFVPVPVNVEQLRAHRMLCLQSNELPDDMLDARSTNLATRPAPPLLINRREDDATRALREFLAARDGRTLIAAESPGHREMLADAMRRARLPLSIVENWPAFLDSSQPTMLAVAPLERGTLLNGPDIALLTEFELFGDRPRTRRRRRVKDPEALINDLTDLRPGAPVIHEAHGIGRYVGLTRLEPDGTPGEFLTLEYAGGDRLHVPVGSLHLISRYTGAAPEQAPLHRLGSDQWARARRKAARRVRDAAAELLDLYARRAARKGLRATIDDGDYAAFASDFPFELTEDQASAVDEVLANMHDAAPMDRLVCGDVGFGKTEVALRAAFVAVSNGWQVAMLVPTTLLAQQHHQTFADRFADWPVNIELLSRFRSQREAAAVVGGIAKGTVDIVIGTHRLLQRNVRFKNLGLVIIDEEHRFGVRAKEKLKALRTEVDILTLTATPIPRTLNMSLGGLRDLSLIATPPESRLSIKTFVIPWESRVIREACLREMKRGGQVYFVHNRIKDIEQVAAGLAELVPEATIEVAHGQMPERRLERIMLDFYHRRFHILLCTAIIESGLDVPAANTIIINRADRFGLAQLHQLRGRVGRSHHQAFAYLIAPPPASITKDAKKRLDAIESLEDLGAGFVLATHDLEIRGAGELLGEDQSGQIQEIGFSLYNEMLSRTVDALRAGLEPDLDQGMEPGLEINLHLPALIPEDYLPDVHLRLVHYKRIASARDDAALDALQIELIDRFGLLPDAARALFRLTAMRLRAEPLGIARIDIGTGGGYVEFATQTRVEPALLVELLESEPDRYRLDRLQKLRVSADLEDPGTRMQFVETLIDRLAVNT